MSAAQRSKPKIIAALHRTQFARMGEAVDPASPIRVWHTGLDKSPPDRLAMDTLDSPVAIIPAAGRATRLGELPCSKELLPVGFIRDGASWRPKPVSRYLVDQIRRTPCQRLIFVLRAEKLDIARYYGHGKAVGLDVAYAFMDEPYGPPFTISQALPFAANCAVLVGFPDILIDPPDAFAQTWQALAASTAQVMLASFPATAADACDLVAGPLDPHSQQGVVERLQPKETNPVWQANDHAWLLAAWRPVFSDYLRRALDTLRKQAENAPRNTQPEWPLGTVLAMALRDGIRIERRHFPDGRFLDVGAPQRLARATTFPGVIAAP